MKGNGKVAVFPMQQHTSSHREGCPSWRHPLLGSLQPAALPRAVSRAGEQSLIRGTRAGPVSFPGCKGYDFQGRPRGRPADEVSEDMNCPPSFRWTAAGDVRLVTLGFLLGETCSWTSAV